MDNVREVVRSYGPPFDELVELVANAMAATGYPSKYASVPPGVGHSKGTLADSVIGLGLLCARIETALLERTRLVREGAVSEGFLSIYAAAKRLVILFRHAQSVGSIRGRVAAEVDGEIDNLEEIVMRLESPEAVVEASKSIVVVSLRFQDGLPKALQEQVLELDRLLGK